MDWKRKSLRAELFRWLRWRGLFGGSSASEKAPSKSSKRLRRELQRAPQSSLSNQGQNISKMKRVQTWWTGGYAPRRSESWWRCAPARTWRKRSSKWRTLYTLKANGNSYPKGRVNLPVQHVAILGLSLALRAFQRNEFSHWDLSVVELHAKQREKQVRARLAHGILDA